MIYDAVIIGAAVRERPPSSPARKRAALPGRF